MPARDLRFSRAPVRRRWYMGGDPVPSTFLSALSSTFPLGEKFFIDSVRRFRNDVSTTLEAEIDAFVAQEAFHTREHLAFNRLVGDLGYSTAEMTERTRAVLAPYRTKSPLRQLGLTMALEHFTALFAHEVLTRDRRLRPAPDSIRALWRWHAMEEIEHKAVAFDTFAEVTRSWAPHRRYGFRVRAMVEATWVLLTVVARNMNDLFGQDDLPKRATWTRAVGYFFGPRGVLTSMALDYLAWFRPGFHPWQIDDRALAQQVERELAASNDGLDPAIASAEAA